MYVSAVRFGHTSVTNYCLDSIRQATAVGFHWSTDAQYVEALRREVDEFVVEAQRQPQQREAMISEVGDVVFSAIALAERYGINPSEALRGTTDRFNQRLAKMQTMVPKPIADMTLEEKWHWFKATKKALATP